MWIPLIITLLQLGVAIACDFLNRFSGLRICSASELPQKNVEIAQMHRFFALFAFSAVKVVFAAHAQKIPPPQYIPRTIPPRNGTDARDNPPNHSCN